MTDGIILLADDQADGMKRFAFLLKKSRQYYILYNVDSKIGNSAPCPPKLTSISTLVN